MANLVCRIVCLGFAFSLVGMACAETPPDRLEFQPSGPFVMTKKGQSDDVKVTAYVGKKPYTRPFTAAFSSSDTSVATINEQGHVACTGSGIATLTASALGASGTAELRCTVIGGLAVTNTPPTKFRLNKDTHTIAAKVTDDKGNALPKAKVLFRATDYCVEVNDDGLVTPLATGECDVIVTSGEFSQRVSFNVTG